MKFANMHKEQHVSHYYEAHAIKRKLDTEHQLRDTLKRSLERYKAAGDTKSWTITKRKIEALESRMVIHQKHLARAEKIAAGIGEMKEGLVKDSGTLTDDADQAHAQYVEKMGERFRENPARFKAKVIDISSAEIGVDIQDRKACKAKVLDILKPAYQDKPKKVTTHDGDNIIVAWNGIKHAMNAGLPTWQESAAALHIDGLIANSFVMQVLPDKLGRNDPKSTTIYQAKANFDGAPHQVSIFVRNHSDGNRYYDHVTIEGKSPAGLTGSETPTLPFTGDQLEKHPSVVSGEGGGNTGTTLAGSTPPRPSKGAEGNESIVPSMKNTSTTIHITKDGDIDENGLVFRNGRWHRDDESQVKETPLASADEYHYSKAEDAYQHSNRSGAKLSRDNYVNSINSAYEKLNNGLNEEQKKYLDDSFIQLKKDYLKKEQPVLSTRSNMVSAHIAGKSKFDNSLSTRGEAANDRATNDFSTWFKGAVSDIEYSLSERRSETQKANDESRAKDKKVNAAILDFAGQISSMLSPGNDKSAFVKGATKSWQALIDLGDDVALDAFTRLNEVLSKNGGGLEAVLGKRSNLWKDISEFLQAQGVSENNKRPLQNSTESLKPRTVIKMTMDEWKQKSKDYKSINNGQRSVMVMGGSYPVEIVKDQAQSSKGQPVQINTPTDNKPLLWEGAQTNQLKESPSAVSGKSNDTKSIAPSEKTASYTYAKPSTIDTPAQGELNGAREGKKTALKRVADLRERIKNEPLNGNRTGLRLELIRAKHKLNESEQAENDALEAIEKRANQLGLTTINPKSLHKALSLSPKPLLLIFKKVA